MLTENERDAIIDKLGMVFVKESALQEVIDLLCEYTEIDVCKGCISYRSCLDDKTERCDFYRVKS